MGGGGWGSICRGTEGKRKIKGGTEQINTLVFKVEREHQKRTK